MIGIRIAETRKKMGISQALLAQRINVSASAIGMYEQGRRKPSIDTVVALSKAMGITVDYLLTGKDSSSRSAPEVAGMLIVLQENLPISSETRHLTAVDLKKVLDVLK